MKTRVIFVDVDDTLVRSVGTRRIPMPAVIAQVRRLHLAGVTLYLWSSGGADYCREVAAELGLSDCFAAFLPKPDLYIDDQPIADWRDCQHLYPAQADNA